MKKILQVQKQSLIDLAIQSYGTLEGLELILLNNPILNIHSTDASVVIESKIFNSRSEKILNLFQSEKVEIIGVNELDTSMASLNQFTDQFSDQFY